MARMRIRFALWDSALLAVASPDQPAERLAAADPPLRRHRRGRRSGRRVRVA